MEKQPRINTESETGPEEFPNLSGYHAVEQLHKDALANESFEDAAAALDQVEALQEFRSKTNKLPFSSFYEIVEEVSSLDKLPLPKEKKREQAFDLAEKMEPRAARFSPRVADLYAGILAQIKGEAYEPKFKMTGEKLDDLIKGGDLKNLCSGQVSWDVKLNRIETRLVGYLSGARDFDRREGKDMDDDVKKWRQEELTKAPIQPPQRRGESKPGVDAMERLKEGERVPAIWSISPPWGGYYKEQSFSKWDDSRNVWTEDEYTYSDAETIPLSGNADHKKGPIDITMRAKATAGQWLSAAIPYTHGLHKIEADGRSCATQQDQNGDLVVYVEGEGEVEIEVFLAPKSDKKFTSAPSKIKVPSMPAEFSEETDNKLEEIKNKKKGNLIRARAIASYARQHIKYLAPKDNVESEKYNIFYNNHEKGFAGAVDEIKEADCDVANTYFAALCAKLNISVRHVVGHSVKGKDRQGLASINSGTGHGWSEVWDDKAQVWVRVDATPPGDPNLEEDNAGGGESAPGDYGEQEAMRPKDEMLEELRQKLAEHKEELSYTKEERYLAEGAGIELKEARRIVKEINEAEATRLPSGERVVDALSQLFNSIVQSRKSVASVYEGPVRKREGGERIEDIIKHKIGMVAGESDPLSREKPAEETKEEKLISGFDLYMIGDKSGSMLSTVEGEPLWEMQRRAEYLIFSSLHRFERSIERAGLNKENSLAVRTMGISFRGDNPKEDLDLDKTLSSQFTDRDKVKMWHSLTEKGAGNGDTVALSYIYDQIKKEIHDNEQKGVKDNRLRLVIACSDGGYTGNDSVTMRQLAQELGKMNVIVVGMGLTETAASVPVVMNNPPFSRGDIARDINDLPYLVAKHVVLEAIKLFPSKAQEGAKQIIESSIAKFKNVK